jgi:MoxR-like ATPase
MMAAEQLRYEGYDDSRRKEPKYQPPIKGERINGRDYYPYFPTEELQEAVNLAIALGRPLLLDGEPGCGKSRLADAIVYEFMKKSKGKGWFFREWNVKSIGQAQDGLYRFDGLARLRDAQMIASQVLTDNEIGAVKARLQDPNKVEYIDFGPLGDALKQTECLRPIVLIDEIDKADSDFPNDLLRELDRLEFTVAETQTTYPKEDFQPKPIVIITSNQERPLPEAFLRRCLYFKLEFPDTKQLRQILEGRFVGVNGDLLDLVIGHFQEIRAEMEGQPGAKPPGTSEILDFLAVLQEKSIEEVRELIEQLPQRPSLLGVILKSDRDQQRYREAFGGEEG